MAKKRSKRSGSKAGHAAKAAVGGKGNVRKRVHDLTLRAVRDNNLTVDELPGLAREVVRGAAAGLDKSMPRSERSVLRQVVGGLTDAAAVVAKAARERAMSAGERGAAFVKSDLRRTAKDVEHLETQFLDSIGRAGRALTGTARAEIDAIVDEARRVGTKLRDVAETTRAATDGRIRELGRESADTGARAARRTLGTLLQGAGGFLEGLADAVTKSTPRAETPARRPAGAKRSPARKRPS